MKPIYKVLIGIAALLVLLISLLVIYIITLFDPNDYKAEIQALVEKQTELKLTIKGDLSLSVFPWIGVNVHDITIDTPSEPLASASQARVFAKFWPLLRGNVEVDGIALKDLKLTLVVDQQGQGNWEITQAGKDKAATGKTPDSVTAAQLPLAAFTVGSIAIDNADISYRDLGSNQYHRLQDFNFSVSNANLDSKFGMSADFTYQNQQQTAPLPVHLTTNVLLSLANDSLELSETVMDLGDTRISGDTSIRQLQAAPAIESQLKIKDLQPSAWATVFQLPSLADITARLNLQAQLSLDTASDQFTLSKFSLTSPQLDVHGSLNAADLTSNLSYSGALALNRLNLKALLPQLGIEAPETADAGALNSLTGQVSFKGASDELTLGQLTLKLDNTRLNGSVGVKNFAQPALRFNLNADTINLDRYLPAENAAAEASGMSANKSKAAAVTADQALLLPLVALREINSNGQFHADRLIASGHTLDNLDIKVSATDGVINLQNLSAKLYGGALKADASIDARSNMPRIKINNQLSNIDAGPLLKALSDIDYVAGKLNLKLNASTTGNTLEAIKRNLYGSADLAIEDGLLTNINVDQMVCEGIAKIRNAPLPASSGVKETRFKSFTSHMNITKGVMDTDQLLVALENLRLTGTGMVDLPNESLDYLFKARLHGDLQNQTCEVHPRYRDIDWPIRCKGSWEDEPKKLCGLDQRELQNIIARMAEQELRRKADDKIQDVLKEKLGDDAAEKLKGLFGL